MERLEIIYMNTEDLVPYENNPRDNSDAVAKVAASIKEFGFKNPIVISEDRVIIAGHTRLLAAESLGLEEVPTIQVSDLSEEQVRAFRIADNKTAEYSIWDEQMLADELVKLEDSGYDLGLTGFDLSEINELFDDGEEEEIEEDDWC
jgi:ParB/RepB/Spo0J family partition protein